MTSCFVHTPLRRMQYHEAKYITKQIMIQRKCTVSIILEHELKTELLRIVIPVSPIPPSIIIIVILYFHSWDTKSNSFVRLSSNLKLNRKLMALLRTNEQKTHDEVLISSIWRLTFLLPSTHESLSGYHARFNLR